MAGGKLVSTRAGNLGTGTVTLQNGTTLGIGGTPGTSGLSILRWNPTAVNPSNPSVPGNFDVIPLESNINPITQWEHVTFKGGVSDATQRAAMTHSSIWSRIVTSGASR